MKTNLAIDCGSDDARSVGSFKVSTHDLVKLPIAQTLENCGFVKCVVLNSKLTMHFSFKHFVLRRSIAFWFLSENLVSKEVHA